MPETTRILSRSRARASRARLKTAPRRSSWRGRASGRGWFRPRTAGRYGLAAARAAMPKGLAKDRALDDLNAAKAAWRTADCKSCAEFDFKSGDVLIFDGSPAADVAHGVLDTLAGTGPAELPDWAKGCAVSLQYRQRRK